ncbi:rhombosortase [Geothermobacter hydrogeniphilus]|uniref:Rhombosortase n=1 Tax=Geothermobacter hydrogeniphilus TaxID=1969733 RepID=A0A2K2H6M1_9BACT|nr:rhombosortase [Geothermobacter hydrogeniphilus]PNU18966.1 rhombosortase [Geothermobacter hydrogeniphilus]
MTTLPITATTQPELHDNGLRHLELGGWLLLLCLCNLGLLANRPTTQLMFDPAAVAAGQWWRLLSWPLVHVSRYHLLLDGSAFLLLLSGLREESFFRRSGYVLLAAAGSLAVPLLLAPELSRTGLCGLSGIAHGLAAVSALELIQSTERDPAAGRLGWLLLAGLLIKTGWELGQGQVIFADWHLGSVGHPIVSTHAGGFLGGILGFLLRQLSDGRKTCQRAGQPLN